MMGRSHVPVGAASYLALLPLVGQVGQSPASVAGVCAGTLAAAGASMLPDLDHPQARAAGFLGPISRQAARAIALVSGGHRNGTHSLAALAVIVGLAWWGLPALGTSAQIVALAVLMALGACVLMEPAPESVSILAACAATWALFASGVGIAAGVGPAIAVGYASHLVGDCLTPAGCPLGWPLSKRRQGVGVFRTDGMIEKGVALVAVLLVAWLGWGAISDARASAPAGTHVAPHARPDAPDAARRLKAIKDSARQQARRALSHARKDRLP